MRIRAVVVAALASALAATLACDGGLEPEPVPPVATACPSGLVGICGAITFQGTEPPNTEAVYVGAFETFPQTCADLVNFQPLPPQALPRPYQGSKFYTLELDNGSYEWVLAVWKKPGQLTLTPADTALLREAGHYRDPAAPATPGAVVVSGRATESIDFVVDFGDLHPVTDYLSCEPAP